MELDMDGKVALVMGASKGIGRGIAAALAREGPRPAICSRSEESLKEAAEQIDIDARPFAADTSDLESLAGLPAEVEKELGPIEILITNTGGPPAGGVLDFELDQWHEAYRS